ncbi:hypothetical protein [Algoriphagus confluentis]|uniref:hypothetical protein n=1 Tax=Algoriphagus confluentis TaxID=1697556 RepID=UPI0030C65AE9
MSQTSFRYQPEHLRDGSLEVEGYFQLSGRYFDFATNDGLILKAGNLVSPSTFPTRVRKYEDLSAQLKVTRILLKGE